MDTKPKLENFQNIFRKFSKFFRSQKISRRFEWNTDDRINIHVRAAVANMSVF